MAFQAHFMFFLVYLPYSSLWDNTKTYFYWPWRI